MDTQLFDIPGIAENTLHSLLNTYAALKAKYPLTYDKEYTFDFKQYELFEDYSRADLIYLFDLGNINKSAMHL